MNTWELEKYHSAALEKERLARIKRATDTFIEYVDQWLNGKYDEHRAQHDEHRARYDEYRGAGRRPLACDRYQLVLDTTDVERSAIDKVALKCEPLGYEYKFLNDVHIFMIYALNILYLVQKYGDTSARLYEYRARNDEHT